MDPILGEVRMFAGRYAPQNWHLCDGTLLSVNEYQALFALLGNVWGGDGVTNFALPDLRGRLPVGQGQGTNLTNRTMAQKGGASQVTLTEANLPAHSHTFSVSNADATVATVSAGVGLAQPVGSVVRYAPPSQSPTPVAMDPDSVTYADGGSLAHQNVMPFLAINYMICVQGLYPQRPS